jgi:hypothetical protein
MGCCQCLVPWAAASASCHGLLPVRAYLLQSALDALVSVGTFQTSTRSNETVTKP